jgi:hypothetical protein
MASDDNIPSGLPTTDARRAVKQPPVLFDRTQALLREVEGACNMPVIVFWNSWQASICAGDIPSMYQVLWRTGPMEKAALCIKSQGGDIESALRLVHLMRRYVRHLTVLIASECASSATIMALGADEIHMGPLAFLTPIDTSLLHSLSPIDQISNARVRVSRDELMRIVRLWTSSAKDHHDNPYSDIFQYVHPLVMGAIDRSSSLSAKICNEVLSYHIKDDAQRAKISTTLNSEFPSHGYPITDRAAREIGLNIKGLDDGTNRMLLQLYELYSEMAQRAITDYDTANYHDNQILGLIEARDVQIYYQNDKDLNYLKEERRWQVLNDESSWRKIEVVDGEKRTQRLHVG